MSTSIALQNLSSPSSNTKTTSTIRHRSVPKQDTKPPSTPSDEDPWLNTPHDARLPLDTPSFAPTTTFWITPHSLFTRTIPILDLTPSLPTPYPGLTAPYKDAIARILKDHSPTPTYTCLSTTWLGLHHTITDSQGATVAEWSHPWTSTGKATLTFPADSTHCSHPITLSNTRWGLRSESFTLDSVPYVWEMDSLWHSSCMSLVKVFGERRVEVGKYVQKWWGSFVTGGVLVVDGREVDVGVACWTLLVVLKKKRQRAGERKEWG